MKRYILLITNGDFDFSNPEVVQTDNIREALEERKDLDFGYSVNGVLEPEDVTDMVSSLEQHGVAGGSDHSRMVFMIDTHELEKEPA